jgi:hypothetical protein
MTTKIKFSGRFLYLSCSEAAVRSQLAGQDLGLDEASPLRDDISTDEITPIVIFAKTQMWLSVSEKELLQRNLDNDKRESNPIHTTLLKVLFTREVAILSVIYFMVKLTGYEFLDAASD